MMTTEVVEEMEAHTETGAAHATARHLAQETEAGTLDQDEMPL